MPVPLDEGGVLVEPVWPPAPEAPPGTRVEALAAASL